MVLLHIKSSVSKVRKVNSRTKSSGSETIKLLISSLSGLLSHISLHGKGDWHEPETKNKLENLQ